ncbi:MAG: recombinase family protein [Candidatus Paceibacterota bacterium]
METPTFFLYARKSTDVEDKQVLSIEAQLAELRSFAKQEGLAIQAEFVEKKSAKLPGRPVFNEMMVRLEKKEAEGIISWHPDRLARNSVDGGRVVYLLDCGHISMLKFPTFWFENTSQGKFMLSIAFGQSKYYVDSLSENTKRGLRQKVRRGEYPGLAPMGYINDSRTKTVVVDKNKAPAITAAFEYYATGEYRLEDVANFLAQRGIKARGGKPLHRTRITCILSNPFYTGLFTYAGELHEGSHQPIVAKKLFDQVQEVMQERGRPHTKLKNEPQAYCGLMRCGTCGMMITAEHRVKKQKNGNMHEYVYYRCTKKSKQKCDEPYVREEEMDTQVSALLKSVSLPASWAQELRKMLAHDERTSAHDAAERLQAERKRVQEIERKLERLLDSYLEQDIEREVYLEKKAQLLSEKKSLQEKTAASETARIGWLEPMREWIQEAENLPKIARDGTLFAKKVAAKEIFGSNLRLRARALSCLPRQNGSTGPLSPYFVLSSLRASRGSVTLSHVLGRLQGIEP